MLPVSAMAIDEMDSLYEIVGQGQKQGEKRPGLMARATAEAVGVFGYEGIGDVEIYAQQGS